MTAQPVPADPPAMTPEQAAQPMTVGMLPSVLAGLAPAIRDYLQEALTPLVARLETLERRETLAFRGVWRSNGAPYPRGSLCSHAGGLWHANSPTSTRPGEDPSWTLVVKRGSGGSGT